MAVFFRQELSRHDWRRAVACLGLVGMVSHGAYYSAFQLQGREDAKALASYPEILKLVSRSDLVLFDDSAFLPLDAVKTPLVFFYGLNISTIHGLLDLDGLATRFPRWALIRSLS